MGAVQILSTVVAYLVTVVAVAFAVRAARRMVAVIRLGQPDPSRFDDRRGRTATMLRETLGHTRMLKWSVVGVAHWFVMVAFILLASLVVAAYFEVLDPTRTLPIVGGWTIFGLVTEVLSVLGVLAIGLLIVVRLLNLPRRRSWSRFAGSTSWQAYYVEYTILAVLVVGLLVRGTKAADGALAYPVWAAPVSHALGGVMPASGDLISLLALLKILISMAWVIVISTHVTMGVAWHRFTAFPNIYFKRSGDAAPALGALKPMTTGGEPIDFETADPETDQFGVAEVEQFSWKGLLDFTTCTECGRCQDQCPAWHTGKPLSPKLVVLSLRDHAYAKAPYLLAGGGKSPAGEEKASAEQLASVPASALAEAQRSLIGGAEEAGIIDPDALWACTTCGACVEQCPVDIEHVDHIVDLRRHQVMIESSFPPEAGAMLRNLENKGNPWGAANKAREDWTKGLDFEVPRVGDGSANDFEYLFWVGCAGALEDRAKKTTRAVATLLHQAGVNFAILGEGETCTGDPARRIGNEFLFQMFAEQNVETLNEAFGDRSRPNRKIVATCPHCFNTLGNEYSQFGGEYEVIHHTQLLSQLVGDGRLTPIRSVAGGLTWHDPCYLGRHNQVYEPPRELLGDALVEMPRNSERSFCCGAGGARMWMEERIGKRINTDRAEEAIATGAGTVAVGCPFCYTMLGDGVAGAQAGQESQVEVVDVATVLLRANADSAT
ncbi:(Fe-S)-binding protein [Natronosporangium hydrolyticum]|uniref:(Fe-S)-binding protein n=1 Tax=Natronosporangium hydrolyticum TaxID=2811111 RepID=A0A895YH90_9ACTN|nr:(Fe-S)-binding protein [Natronosporangium hydrolyticum]QSB14753.1 (Fe-S)-binding protein [Natronosporangium hydrolyticum]